MKRIVTIAAILLALGSLCNANEYPLPEESYPSIENKSSVWMLEIVVIPDGCDSSSQCLSERTWYLDPGSKATFDMLWNDHFTFKLRGIKHKGAVDKERYKWDRDKLLVSVLADRMVSFSDETEKTVVLQDEDFSNPEEYTGLDPWTFSLLENATQRWLLGSELKVSQGCWNFYPSDPCSRGRIIYLEPGNSVRHKAPEDGAQLEITGIVSSLWGIQQRTVSVKNFHTAAPNIVVSGHSWLFPEQGSLSLDFKHAKGPISFLFR